MGIIRNDVRYLIYNLNYTSVAASYGGFVANDPLAIVAHAERLEELIFGNTEPTEEVRERQSKSRLRIIW